MVTNPDGQSGSLANGFTFVAPPAVTTVSPTSGPSAGGTAVTLTGTDFTTGATVTFGGVAATNVIVVERDLDHADHARAQRRGRHGRGDQSGWPDRQPPNGFTLSRRRR